MDAEEFYIEYKAALVYLGISWGDKSDVAVWVQGGYFIMSANGKQAHIKLSDNAG
jgi:hypothetical protein